MQWSVWRNLIVALLLGAAALAAWFYIEERLFARKWDPAEVSRAGTFRLAQQTLAQFEAPPDAHRKMMRLTAYWGTGDLDFDQYLARHLLDPGCGDALRERFCAELGWRDKLRERWVNYWCWKHKREPSDAVAEFVELFDEELAEKTPPPIRWREVLDLLAVFELAGRSELARLLTPDNAVERYRKWRTEVPEPKIERARPSKPFTSAMNLPRAMLAA